LVRSWGTREKVRWLDYANRWSEALEPGAPAVPPSAPVSGWVSFTLVGGRLCQTAVDRRQKSVHWLCSLRYNARTWQTACAPSSLQRIPAPFIRRPTTVLHALSTAPEPMYQPVASVVRCTVDSLNRTPAVSFNSSVPFSKLSATVPQRVASRSIAGERRRAVNPTRLSQGQEPLTQGPQ
jgi:hypothetical protein